MYEYEPIINEKVLLWGSETYAEEVEHHCQLKISSLGHKNTLLEFLLWMKVEEQHPEALHIKGEMLTIRWRKEVGLTGLSFSNSPRIFSHYLILAITIDPVSGSHLKIETLPSATEGNWIKTKPNLFNIRDSEECWNMFIKGWLCKTAVGIPQFLVSIHGYKVKEDIHLSKNM